MKVYLDNCCFNRPFDDQSQLRIHLESAAKLEIQDRVRKRDLDLIWSYILEYENDANPFAERRERISAWKKLAKYHVPPSDSILSTAEGIKEFGIKNKDSLHLACAIEIGAERFFTTDDQLLRKRGLITELMIENPVDFTISENRND